MRFNRVKAGLALLLGIALTATKALLVSESNEIQLSNTSSVTSSWTTSYTQLLSTTIPEKEKDVKGLPGSPWARSSDISARANFVLQTEGDMTWTDVDNFQAYVGTVYPDTQNWIFYSGDDYTDEHTDAFLAAVEHDPAANPTSVGKIYPVAHVESELIQQMGPGNEYKPWALISYRYASAATGTAHVFLPAGRDLLHPYLGDAAGVPRISNWERYKLSVLTRPGGPVNRILRYDSGGSLDTATIVWDRASSDISGLLGVPWDFATPPWQNIPDAAPGAEPDLSRSSWSIWRLLCCKGSCCL